MRELEIRIEANTAKRAKLLASFGQWTRKQRNSLMDRIEELSFAIREDSIRLEQLIVG